MISAAEGAARVFSSADLSEKIDGARALFADWRAGRATNEPARTAPGPRPGRPERPTLAAPKDVPKRSFHTVRGRAALLHAIAHIELNAIDLALDLVARFTGAADIGPEHRDDFIDDWLGVADDEARHFAMLGARLKDLGATYGDLPAHDGLWEAAEQTLDDVAARLALGPMTLEARGLDVTPAMIEKFQEVSDDSSAEILRVIYREEVAHVAAGRRWFEHICAKRGIEPFQTYKNFIKTRFKGGLKTPFNEPARDEAGLFADYYRDLAT